MTFYTPDHPPATAPRPPHRSNADWQIRPPTLAESHRMAGKSPTSSVIGVLALLALGGLILFGVQTLSKGLPGAPSTGPAKSNAATTATSATLHLAAAKGDAVAITNALSAGADINAPSTEPDTGRLGMTPLMIACMDGNTPSVKALLDAKAKSDLRTDDGRTALMFAAGWGDAARVQALIDAGARVDSRTTDGRTALMWAAHRGEVGTVSALLSAGADVNATNKWRQTALMAAAGAGSLDKVTALLDAGANVADPDQRGETALYSAASGDAPAEVLDLLLNRGAPADAADADGVTPLMKAAERADLAQVVLLIKAGASLTAKDKINTWTAYDWAAKRDDEKGKAVADTLAAANKK